MNKVVYLLTGAIAAGSVAVIDLPSTVGVKSIIIGMLPVESADKAQMVLNLCKRALPTPVFASTQCFEANASDAWRSEFAERNERQSNTQQACRLFEKVLSAPREVGSSGAKVIDDDGIKAAIMGDDGTIYSVDRTTKTIGWIKDGIQAIDCPSL
ncbi:hypothetical protein HGK82_00735 [Ochrobactrum sp. MT180101]|nr:hypothetical protein HGK82_00735 [Ochrobactrum sp. MT180101]